MTQRKPARNGPGRPAGIDSVETRRRVIHAAIRCFAQSGYGPATNSQIAGVAGVTAGAVYYHFGTKDGLFAAVCDEVYGTILQRAQARTTDARSVRELLRAVLEVSMLINHESPELAGFVVTAPIDARRYPELSQAYSRWATAMHDSLTDSVRAGQQAGAIPADLDPGQVARMITALVDGFAHAAAASDPISLDTLVLLFETLVLENEDVRRVGQERDPVSSRRIR
ncbi:TetR/AcrR family transcriptional regulator [Nocardia sp. CDC159]|uniref:TetR/AcrR family transcriptional regulator n=1 Tax=Nocardia pulmonis TaxID=2951408 RepID=A0A9X2E2P6_9NOCA|nr:MULTISPECIES: TetR/AcrR family transcriptional regulator [Nocardia]MCM6772551.1 TetR/AcrR family transcriptional regulator [Nocardia pulmonis]MCM6784791.1 TetR/AcrR family transcriptional regulator [Nocardia sp. CDC159]